MMISRNDSHSARQSVKERDRQRELQQQERQRMQTNEEKDLSSSSNLFHAPVRVEPSSEDLEIQNTLGNYDHVRHYVVDGPNRGLIGVDQNQNPALHRLHPGRVPPSGVRHSGGSGTEIKTSASKVPPNVARVLPTPNPSPPVNNSVSASSAAGDRPDYKKPLVVPHNHSKSSNSAEIVLSTQSSKSEKHPSVNHTESNHTGVTNENKKVSFKKPALESADGELELESIIKEMMDVSAPITAISSPVKESKKIIPPTKPVVSNSEELIVKTIENEMTNIQKPISKMDSSDSSSSDSSSDSESEDSSSGSQECVDIPDSAVPAVPPTQKYEWNLGAFLPPTEKNEANGVKESNGDTAVKMESVVTSTSVFSKAGSSAVDGRASQKLPGALPAGLPGNTDGQVSKVPGKSPHTRASENSYNKAAAVPSKGSSSSANKTTSLSATSSEDEEAKKIADVVKSETEKRVTRKPASKRPRRSCSELNGTKTDEEDSPPESNAKAKLDINKQSTIQKLFLTKKVKMDSPTLGSPTDPGRMNAPSTTTTGKGKTPPNQIVGKGKKPPVAKTQLVQNGDINRKNTGKTEPEKKRDIKEGRRTAKSQVNAAGISAKGDVNAPIGRLKDEPGKPTTLMCRILLSKLSRPPSFKTETNLDKTGTVKPHYDANKVSSSDHPGRSPAEVDEQRDTELETPKHHRKQKKKAKSPRKSTKSKKDTSIDARREEDSRVVINEATSNTSDFLSEPVRTPPLDVDAAQAPDSSLNPPHLPSPVVPQHPVYFSYFERNETIYDEFCSRDQDTYLEEAKRLKHKADNEKVSTTQASTYLEAGLYFILTGLSMERDRAVGSQAAYTMYKDTLSLIRYIAGRFRLSRNDMEAKIVVLSMRCQSLLHLKLFKIKMDETKKCVQFLQDHFSKTPPEATTIPSSPQLSTPSPHSPTSSPAGSSGILAHTPSPHPYQNHNHASIPWSVYSKVSKQCSNTMNLIQSHELWEQADVYVERHHIEEFFIAADRLHGPLTLHNSLVDLVRYVKHCLATLKMNSDIS